MSLGKESPSARNAESFCQSKHVLDNNNEALRDGPLEKSPRDVAKRDGRVFECSA